MAAVRDDGALKALVFCALNTFSETDSSFERRRASTSLSDSLSERAAGLVGVVVFLSSSAPVEGRGPVSRAMTTTTTTTRVLSDTHLLSVKSLLRNFFFLHDSKKTHENETKNTNTKKARNKNQSLKHPKRREQVFFFGDPLHKKRKAKKKDAKRTSSFLPNIKLLIAIFFCDDDDDDEALSLPLLLLRRRRPLFRASAFFVSVEETDDARFLSKRERERERAK